MRNLTNEELRETYLYCEKIKRKNKINDDEIILAIYNKEFDTEIQYGTKLKNLSYHMIIELMQEMEKEMSRRFLESK